MSTRVKAAVKVVGMVAGGREDAVAKTMLGDVALVVPEPDNPYDANAAAVYVVWRATLNEPDAIMSSVRDPAGVGYVGESDREAALQVGYVPRQFAATLDLPAGGIVGWVSDVRYAPPEYDRFGRELDHRIAGLDVTASWPRMTGGPLPPMPDVDSYGY